MALAILNPLKAKPNSKICICLKKDNPTVSNNSKYKEFNMLLLELL